MKALKKTQPSQNPFCSAALYREMYAKDNVNLCQGNLLWTYAELNLLHVQWVVSIEGENISSEEGMVSSLHFNDIENIIIASLHHGRPPFGFSIIDTFEDCLDP